GRFGAARRAHQWHAWRRAACSSPQLELLFIRWAQARDNASTRRPTHACERLIPRARALARVSQSGNGHGGHRDVDAEFPAGADHQALRRVSLLVRQPRVLRRLRARLPAAALPDGRVGDEAPRARGEVLLVAPRAVLVRVDAPARLEEAL